jgi:type 1 glutamine amidotransferase/cytochrome c553
MKSIAAVHLAIASMIWLGSCPSNADDVLKTLSEPAVRPKKIVLLAGKKSHGPGVHEYEKSVRLLKVMLDRAEKLSGIKTEYHLNGWPADPRTLDDADTIMTISDGQDGDLYSPVPWMTPERMAVMERQMRRGCGFLTFHFSTFAPDDIGQKVLDWGGGYFDWQDDTGRRNWYSQIKTLDADVTLGERTNPVLRGVAPFKLREEFYYRIRFRESDPRLKPILLVPALAKSPAEQTVAWAVERADGGRGFCTTCGHFYDNWQNENFRRLILNALVWTAKTDVPADGVKSRFYSDQEVAAILDERPIRAVIVTGHQYPGHPWRETTLALEDALRRDLRMQVTSVPDPEFLGDEKLRQYDVLVFNYCNWERPGLSERAKAGFTNFVKNGGGLIFIHFANGAFHFSLPKAGDSDWPEFRKICRRVWDHTPGKSAHDPYGRFKVEIAKSEHRLIGGLASFETTDELYFNQQGDEPIEVLATARSKITGRDEPMAFVYTYGNGRVFQTVLGHDAASLRVEGTAALVRRAAAWVTRREVREGPNAEGGGPSVESRGKTSPPSTLQPSPSSAPKSAKSKSRITGHWGESAIGFRWQESDSADSRWNEMDNGSFLASSVATPFGDTAKGLTIRLGDKQEASICYDTGRMAVRAAWTGGFLRFDPARFGLIKTPTIGGKLQFGTRDGAGWGEGASNVRLSSHVIQGDRVALRYTVDDAQIVESPWFEMDEGLPIFRREFEIQPHRAQLSTTICQDAGDFAERTVLGAKLLVSEIGTDRVAAAVVGDTRVATLRRGDKGALALDVAAQSQAGHFAVLMWRGPPGDLEKFARRVSRAVATEDPRRKEGGAPRWRHRPVTRGVVSTDRGAYVVDTLTLPLDNPYKALFFCTGHDFFTNGDAAVCTIHGDVWRVSGIDQRLEKLTWTRFATGLYQPLGLRIVDDIVHVLGRDQITRLHDTDNNGEADLYENFNNQGETTSFGHDYATCLETDRAGNFYYLRSNNTDGKKSGVFRVSRDGRRIDQIASGIRNANGLGIGPDDTLTVGPQEGEWTPGSCVLEIRPGGHYGYGGPVVAPHRPLGYDPPLCWIPRIMDNSTGGQVWGGDERFGPLAGQLINFSYGRCWPLLVLRERIGDVAQGGTVKIDANFLSGACRGRFRPLDGQLYVTGLRGWTTSAVHDGCFQRVRYTGAKAYLPIGLNVHRNGVLLRFTEALDKIEAEDAENYAVEAWNYRYSSAYGSKDYKPSAAGIEGHDEVPVRSATLMNDGRSVFLEIADLRPVMQMEIRMTLLAADKTPIRQTIYNTINVVPETMIPPGTHKRPPRPGDLAEDVKAQLRPGLWRQFISPEGATIDARTCRMPSLFVAAGDSPTAFVPPDAWRSASKGYLKIDSKADFAFSLEGTGKAELKLDGRTVARLPRAVAGTEGKSITLRRGYHFLELRYEPPASADARLRLFWSSETIAREPVPPTTYFFDPGDPVHTELPMIGLHDYAEHHCGRCHAMPAAIAKQPYSWPEITVGPPRLDDAGRRFKPQWMLDWIINPQKHRDDAKMPAVFGRNPTADQRRQAEDIVAYLAGLGVGIDNADAAPAKGTISESDAETLWENLGCIKCHTRDAVSDDPHRRMPLHGASRKFTTQSLAEYLLAPHRHAPASKMPDFRLSATEAATLAEFIAPSDGDSNAKKKPPAVAGDPKRGKELFVTVGCNQCHSTNDVAVAAPKLPTVFGARTDRGCLADVDRRGRAPDFGLLDFKEQQLRRFLETDGAALIRHAPLHAARAYVGNLNCAACHSRDGEPSPGAKILIDEGTLGLPPEAMPDLTLAGEKLEAAWIERLLAGSEPHSRPWLAGRMPSFGAYAKLLAEGLAAEHGLPSPKRTEPTMPVNSGPVVSRRVELGQRLTLKEGGFDCRQCHALGGEVLKVQNDAQGIGLSISARRLRREYYDRWMRDPLRIDPLTKMPKFSPDGVHTPITAILDGDADRQFDAIWHYMHSVRPADDGNGRAGGR